MATSSKLDSYLNNHRYVKGNSEKLTHQRYANEEIKLKGGVFTIIGAEKLINLILCT